MFPAVSSFRMTAACVAFMMMMMVVVTEAAAMPKHSARQHKKASEGSAEKTVPLQLDPKSWVVPKTVRPLENASISPWTYNISTDDSLFPPYLSEARCLLRGCLNSEGNEDLSLESRPIMHQVLLLRRVKSTEAESGEQHSYHYRLESRIIAVGCTCVKPVTQHQQ